MSAIDEFIASSELVTEIFGEWPSFHDAEVHRISLHREGRRIRRERQDPDLEIDIHAFDWAEGLSPGGNIRFQNHTLVTLLFEGVGALDVSGYKGEYGLEFAFPIIFELELARVPKPDPDFMKWSVGLGSSYGVGASFLCESISVLSAEPYEPPPGSNYAKA